MSYDHKSLSILISSASPKESNKNDDLLGYVYEGFIDLLSFSDVRVCDYSEIIQNIRSKKFNLVLIFGSCMPSICGYEDVSYECKKNGMLLAFWMHDDPYEIDFKFKIEKVADFIFTNDRWSSKHYDHEHVHHLPLAASKKHHFRQINSTPIYDLFFCGVPFENRKRILNDLAPYLKKLNTRIFVPGFSNLACNAIDQRLENSLLPDFYSNSAITLNIGRDLNLANDRFQLVPSTPGPRTFEAAMAGALQFYWVDSLEILDYFDENELVLVNGIDDFLQKSEFYLKNPSYALKIKQKCQIKAENSHSYHNRAREIIDTLSIKGFFS